MSPMLPINSQPMSPSMSSNINSTNNIGQSGGSELRYSPLSPHYNNSPMRGYSPSSNRHYSGMSPSYSYNSPSSPNYSPNSSGKSYFLISKVLLPSLDRIQEAPFTLLALLMEDSSRLITLRVLLITSVLIW